MDMELSDLNLDISPIKAPVYEKINYNVFIVIMLAILFLLTAISHINLTRKYPIEQINNPFIEEELNKSRIFSFWILLVTGIIFFVYCYSLLKNN